MNKCIKTFFLDKILLFLVFFFPVIIVLRSAAINIATAAASIIVLFYIFKKARIEFLKNKLVIYIIIFFSFIFINSIIHFISIDLLLKSLGNFRYLFLSIAVLIVLETISEQQKKFFIYFNIIVIFLIALDILYQFIFYKDIFGFMPGMCTETLPIHCIRFSGVFGDELIAGSYLSQIGFLILVLFLNLEFNKKYFNFLIKFFLSIFLLIIILLTGERAALIIVTTSLFFIFFFQKKLIRFFFLFLILSVLIFFSAQKIESINQRFIKLFDNWGSQNKEFSIENFKDKLFRSPWSFHYQAAIELFLEKPIFGHGPKSFRTKCENTNIEKFLKDKRNYSRDYRACSTHPHNYLLEFLSEHGILGALFFVGFIFIVFTNIYKNFRNENNKNIITFIGIGSLTLAIIFPLKPAGSFFTTFNASMLFYIFGFFLYYLKKAK
jgi:O-antigen ligase